MKIIAAKLTLNTSTDAVVLAFNDDKELNNFIKKLLMTPVRTSGLRVLTMIPKKAKLSPIQQTLLDIIEGIDGACGNDPVANKKIVDDTVAKLDNLIKEYS